MISKILTYLQTTVTPLDHLKTHQFIHFIRLRPHHNKKKIAVGFCSIFPPFPNGVAAANYYLIRELARHNDIDLFLIPVKNKIDKKLFAHAHITTVDNPYLDVIIFFGLGTAYEKYSSNASCKKIAWQTMHGDTTTPSEKTIFDQIKKADLVLALTHWTYQHYKKKMNHVAYLPHGVDTQLFKASANTHARFTCLFISRIHYYKGIMPFLDAIPVCLEKDNTILFNIVSPRDKYSPHLQEIHNKLKYLQQKYPYNIMINTSWTLYHKIPALYASADVLVFPSNNEGFGLPLIEAMSTSMPCIVLDKKPMSEIVVDGKTGFCLPPGKNKERYHYFDFPDPTQIAQKILLLKRNTALKERLGQNAREEVVKKYDLKNVVDKLIKYCREVNNT